MAKHKQTQIASQKIIDAALEVADILDRAKRVGYHVDRPEGCRVIALSDTLAKRLSSWLRNGKQ